MRPGCRDIGTVRDGTCKDGREWGRNRDRVGRALLCVEAVVWLVAFSIYVFCIAKVNHNK